MTKTVQNLMMKIEATKKAQTKGTLEIKKKIGMWIGITESSLTNRIKEMEDRISVFKDTVEGMDTSVIENGKFKKFLIQNIQEIWGNMKVQT